jgi:hypothetical protein
MIKVLIIFGLYLNVQHVFGDNPVLISFCKYD